MQSDDLARRPGIGRRGMLRMALGAAGLGASMRPGLGFADVSGRCVSNVASTIDDGQEVLVIDVHCHAFNGLDLPIKDFLLTIDEFKNDRPAILRSLHSALTAGGSAAASMGARDVDKEIQTIAQAIGRRQMPNWICREFPRQFGQLPGTDVSASTLGQNWSRSLSFPRWTNVATLLHAYPQVHLFTPAMVDLYMGAGSGAAPIVNQIELMSQIAVATGGRILPFVPYDPLRALKHELAPDKQSWSPLEWVKRAIEEKGFVGVKLYPPMGFSPSRNKQRACPGLVNDNFFTSKIADDAAFRAEYGDQLDEHLRLLLTYCAGQGVPVMAHANNSNMADRACVEATMPGDYLGSPDQWRDALTDYGLAGKVNLNLAHFGRIDEAFKGLSGAALNGVDGDRIVKELTDLIGQPNGVYADLANFIYIRDSSFRAALAARIDQITAHGSNGIAGKLLYGSDWYMQESYDGWLAYSRNFMRVFKGEMKRKFLGLNAVEYLGLRRGHPNRARIDRFLAANNITGGRMPPWVRLVDA